MIYHKIPAISFHSPQLRLNLHVEAFQKLRRNYQTTSRYFPKSLSCDLSYYGLIENMELDETNYELFRNYLTGDLSPEEEEAFKNRLESDEDFAELFEEEKAFSATVQEVLFHQQPNIAPFDGDHNTFEHPSAGGGAQQGPEGVNPVYILLMALVFAFIGWWLITKVL